MQDLITPAITCKNVMKSFDGKTVLSGLDLHVKTGESVAIIGPSGCGKSVLLKCLLGLETFDSGHISFNGHELENETLAQQMIRLKDIGMVFQASALLDGLSILENVAFGLIHSQHRDKVSSYQIAKQTLCTVGLDQTVEALYPTEISGGMQRRVALARAIAIQPKFLFCDEPTSGLDPHLSTLIARLIRQSIDDMKMTAIIITHDMHILPIIADRVVMLYEGRIIWDGSPEQLMQTDHPVVRSFRGDKTLIEQKERGIT